MANYNCSIRTNYFHVKDSDAFRVLMNRVYGCEDSVDVWEDVDENGNAVFGFGLYGGIAGVRNAENDEDDDCDETAYDEFISGLQACVAPDDAIIILEVGNEKLRYVVGLGTIITSEECKTLNLAQVATDAAAKLLGNPQWHTRLDY